MDAGCDFFAQAADAALEAWREAKVTDHNVLLRTFILKELEGYSGDAVAAFKEVKKLTDERRAERLRHGR